MRIRKRTTRRREDAALRPLLPPAVARTKGNRGTRTNQRKKGSRVALAALQAAAIQALAAQIQADLDPEIRRKGRKRRVERNQRKIRKAILIRKWKRRELQCAKALRLLRRDPRLRVNALSLRLPRRKVLHLPLRSVLLPDLEKGRRGLHPDLSLRDASLVRGPVPHSQRKYTLADSPEMYSRSI